MPPHSPFGFQSEIFGQPTSALQDLETQLLQAMHTGGTHLKGQGFHAPTSLFGGQFGPMDDAK